MNKQEIHNPRRKDRHEDIEEPGRDVKGVFGETVATGLGTGEEEDNKNLFQSQSDTARQTDNADKRTDADKEQGHRRDHRQKPSVETVNFKILMESVDHRRSVHQEGGRNGKSSKERTQDSNFASHKFKNLKPASDLIFPSKPCFILYDSDKAEEADSLLSISLSPNSLSL